MDQQNYLPKCWEVQEFIGRIRIQAILKPSLLSFTFCQDFYPSINCPLQSANELYLEPLNQVIKSYYSIVFSKNWCMMSQQGDDEFWHCKTTLTETEWFWTYVYRNSLIDRNIIWKTKFTTGFGRGLTIATSLPVLMSSWTLSMKFLLTLPWRINWYHSQCEPMKLFGMLNKDSIMISTQQRPSWG